METYNPSTLKSKAYSSIIQNGAGGEMDRYVYNQHGEGLSSFFGSVMKNAIPFLGKAIKGGLKIAKPHITAAGKDLIVAGAKQGVRALSQPGGKRKRVKVSHSTHKKRSKWQSL